ncbi:MAG: hypothetical protein Q8P01_01025, partial [bacterium]|nr:hypothetical protein [bacterium]
MNEDKKRQLGAKIGLLSRIDYGSEGFRRALVIEGFEKFRKEGTHFNALVGGLVSQKALMPKLKAYIKEGLQKEKGKKQKPSSHTELPVRERLGLRKKELEEAFLTRIAKDLADIIPKLTIPHPEHPDKEKSVDLFIMTSPAFDGEIGERVAHILSGLRPDIRLWHQGGDRIFVKYVDKVIWALAPEKAAWMRGDYYSTAVERVIKDKIKQTSQRSPDLYVVGCFGSSINKPKGELKYRYISLPVLHRIEEIRTSENQIGVRVFEFPEADEKKEGDNFLVRTYSFKDLVAQELSFIAPPPDATPIQKKIIKVMKEQNWVTPGTLKYNLPDVNPEQLEKEMKALEAKKPFQKKGENFPGITFIEAGKKYYFDLEWIRRKLRYVDPEEPWQEDRIVSLACIHA